MKSTSHYLEQDFLKALQNDPSLLSIVGDSALDGLWFWDLEYPEEEWFSDSFWTSLGYDPQEMPAKFAVLEDLIPEEHFEKTRQLINLHLEHPDQPYKQTLPYIHKEGHYVWIRCVGQSVWQDGKPIRMLGAHVDVSKEVHLNQDLASFFLYHQNLVLIANEKGQIVRANSGEGAPLGAEETLKKLSLKTLLEDYGVDQPLKRAFEEPDPQIFTLKKESEQGIVYLSCQLWYTHGHYYFTANNATKEHEQRQIAKKQTELKDLLLGLASNFIEAPLKEVPNLINATLAEIGQFVQADRSYIFDYDFEAETTTNTYEWCRSGISPQIENLKDVPMEYFPQWLDCHLKGESMYIPDVTTHHDQELGQFLAEQEITSLLAVPIYGNNKCLGFIGFDWVVSEKAYNPADEDILRVFASMLGQLELRTESQTAVEASRVLNERALNRINKPIMVLHKDSSIHQVNEAFCELSGYPQKDILGKEAPYDFWPSARQEEYGALINKALSGECNSAELELLDKQGNIIPVQTYNEVIQPPDKGLSYLLISFEDLRAQRQLEAHLKAEREFAELLLHNSPIFIFGLSSEGKITQINKKLEEHLPGTKNDWINKPAEQLCVPSQSADFKAKIKSLDTTFPDTITLNHDFLNNEYSAYVEWRFSQPTQSQKAKWIVFGIDITTEAIQKQELKNNKANLQKAQEIARMGSWEINLKTGEHLWSEELYNLLQLPQKLEPSAQHFQEHILPSDQEAVQEQLNLALAGEMEYKIIYRFRRGKNDIVYLEDVGKIYRDAQGTPERFVGSIQDVTFREKSKEKLKTYQEEIERKSLLSNLLVKVNSQLLEGDNWEQVLKLTVKYLAQELDCNTAYGYSLKPGSNKPDKGFTAYFITQWVTKGSNSQVPTPKRITEIDDPRWLKVLERLNRERVLFTNHRSKFRLDDIPQLFPWQLSPRNIVVAIQWNKVLVGMIVLPEVNNQELDTNLLSNLKILSQNLSASFKFHYSYNELKKSNRRSEILHEVNTNAIFEVDLQNQKLLLSRGFESSLKISNPRHLEGLNRRIHPSDLAQVLRKRKQLQNGELKRLNILYRIQDAEGRYILMRERSGLVRDLGQKAKSIIGALSMESDISEYNKLFAMASSKAKLAAVEIDLETNQIHHTPEMLTILDIPENSEQNPMDSPTLIWENQDWVPLNEFFIKFYHSDRAVNQTFKVRTQANNEKWLDIHLQSEQGDGNLSYLTGYMQDISSEVAVQEDYRRANFWLEKSQKTASLGNFIATLSTGNIFISNQGLQLVQAPSDYPTDRWMDFLTSRHQFLLRNGLRKLIKYQVPLDIEVLLKIGLNPDQQEWFHITAEIATDGNDPKVIGTFQNVNKRKKFEEELKIRNNSLRKMAWHQSHLVRAPLSRIMGIISAMDADFHQESNSTLAKHFKDLKASSEELDQTVRSAIETAGYARNSMESPLLTSPDYLIPADDHLQVALVDDDPIVQSLNGNIVRKENLCPNPLTFSNGKLLIDHILSQDSSDNHYLVFLDLNMPVMDGWETLEELHSIFFESNSRNKCLVIILTSSPDSQDLYRAYTFPLVVDYLEKPLRKEKIEQIKQLPAFESQFPSRMKKG